MATCQGFLLVYSIADSDTLAFVATLKDRIFQLRGTNKLPIVLVGNKSDLTGQRQVSTDAGAALAAQHGWPFFETSARADEAIDNIYFELARKIRAGAGRAPDGARLQRCSIL